MPLELGQRWIFLLWCQAESQCFNYFFQIQMCFFYSLRQCSNGESTITFPCKVSNYTLPYTVDLLVVALFYMKSKCNSWALQTLCTRNKGYNCNIQFLFFVFTACAFYILLFVNLCSLEVVGRTQLFLFKLKQHNMKNIKVCYTITTAYIHTTSDLPSRTHTQSRGL